MGTKYKYNETRKEWRTMVYDGTLTPAGLPHRVTISSKKSSKDLERKVAEFKEKLANNSLVLSNVTLGEYADTWLKVYKANKEHNTLKSYQATVNKLEPLFEIELANLTRSHFQLVINLNADKPKTCKNIKQVFTQILTSAYRDGLISSRLVDNITADISLPKYVKPQKEALTPLERNAVLTCELPQKAKIFLLILYYCGLRKSEALALDRDDIDTDKNILNVSKTLIFVSNRPVLKPYPKSDNGIRSIPIAEKLQKELYDYLETCDNTLFPSQYIPYMSDTAYRRMWGHINKAISSAAEKEVKITAHKLRHNFCSELCYQVPKISTKKIAYLLGDNERMVLDVYGHIVEKNENVVEAINSAF